MRRVIVLAMVVVPLAAAAPPPRDGDAERIIKLFGTPVDPDKDCTFKLDRDKLTVTVPDKPHDQTSPNEAGDGRVLANAPRTARKVSGDFIARVRLTARPPADVEPAPGWKTATYAAGLIAWHDNDHRTRLTFTRRLHTEEKQERFNGDWFTCNLVPIGSRPGATTKAEGRFAFGDPILLVITRRGGTFSYAFGTTANGNVFQSLPDTLPAELDIGVYATHTGRAGFSVTFDSFTVEPPPPK